MEIDAFKVVGDVVLTLLGDGRVQVIIAAIVLFYLKNAIMNYWGYLEFKMSPFTEKMVIYHGTSTGETSALISGKNRSTLTLEYDNDGEKRYRFIPMSLFPSQSVDWQLCFDPREKKAKKS